MFDPIDLINACLRGDEEKVNFFVNCYLRAKELGLTVNENFFSTEMEVDLDNSKNDLNYQFLLPIHIVTKLNYPNLLRLLLKVDMIDINAISRGKTVSLEDFFDDSEFGETALCIAARMGLLEIVEILLEHNADVSKPSLYSCDGNKTPLIVSLQNGHLRIAKKLIFAGSPLEATKTCAYHPIAQVVTLIDKKSKKYVMRILKCLLESNVDVNFMIETYNNSYSLIEWAFLYDLDYAKSILESNRVKSKYLLATMRNACKKQNYIIIELLVNFIKIKLLAQLFSSTWFKIANINNNHQCFKKLKSMVFSSIKFIYINSKIENLKQQEKDKTFAEKIFKNLIVGIQSWPDIILHHDKLPKKILMESINIFIDVFTIEKLSEILDELFKLECDNFVKNEINFIIGKSLHERGEIHQLLEMCMKFFLTIADPVSEDDNNDNNLKITASALRERTMWLLEQKNGIQHQENRSIKMPNNDPNENHDENLCFASLENIKNRYKSYLDKESLIFMDEMIEVPKPVIEKNDDPFFSVEQSSPTLFKKKKAKEQEEPKESWEMKKFKDL